MPTLDIAIIDGASGRLIVENSGPLAGTLRADLDAALGQGTDFGCARPAREVLQLPARPVQGVAGVRIAGYWHDSLIEGPGRRSVVQFQGCPIRCAGCWVPETWGFGGGTVVDVDLLANALLDSAHERDGITILGGEPFAQPAALLSLAGELLGRGCEHITVYTGYTLEALQVRAQRDPDVAGVLACINVLIDGPYVSQRAHRADCACDAETIAYSGSCNQRVTTL